MNNPRAESLAFAVRPDLYGRLAISNHGLRNSGGIERYAMTLVRGLHARGLRPTVIAKAFDSELAEYQWVEPVPVYVGALPNKLRDRFFDWRIGHAKRRLGLFPLIGCNQTRWSDIGICGSTHPGFLQAMGTAPNAVDRWKIALERAHLEVSRRIVAHSSRMRDEALHFYGVDPAKIHLLYPPVDTEKFTPVAIDERVRLRSALDIPGDRVVFLLASTGHRRKGLDLLERYFAATRLPATLVVAGRPLGRTTPNVRFLGYRRDMENVYRAVDYTVMASRYEPFGLVGVESVLCGTPVLLADGVGCAEVIHGAGKINFSLAESGGLDAAIGRAVKRWQVGTHRLDSPASSLSYDPSVAVHVEALLGLVQALLDDARR